MKNCKHCGKLITKKELNSKLTEEEMNKVDECCKCIVMLAWNDSFPL